MHQRCVRDLYQSSQNSLTIIACFLGMMHLISWSSVAVQEASRFMVMLRSDVPTCVPDLLQMWFQRSDPSAFERVHTCT